MDNINIEIGMHIQHLRKQSGLDQISFAEQCGISKTHFGRIERGESSMTLDTFRMVSKELGVSMSDLLSAIGL